MNYMLIQNTKTGKWYKVPIKPPAPPFRPKDRTPKPGGKNKYV